MAEKNAYEILSGPFDDFKERIVSIFEKRAGLYKDMSWLPKIDKAGPVFYKGSEPFTYNQDRMHEIAGEVLGTWFRISLSETIFSQDPGEPPHFHHHAITKIEIPGKILFLFRKYPEYYVYCGKNEIDPRKFLDEVIFHRESCLVARYEPDKNDQCYHQHLTKVKTDLKLHRINDLVPDSDLYPAELDFTEVYKIFADFFENLILLLQTAPVTTHNFTMQRRTEN